MHVEIFLFIIYLTLSDLRVSSVPSELSSAADRSFIPTSVRLLLLRSNTLRLEGWELSMEDRVSQLLSDRLQSLSLE